jgi:hypothetical protein
MSGRLAEDRGECERGEVMEGENARVLRSVRTTLTTFAVGLGIAWPAFAADPSAPAVIHVSETVAMTGIEPVGVNLTTITGGTNFATNNFINGSGMEPAINRYLIRVERFGDDWMEWDSFGGVHMWDQNATGWGNGAAVLFFRIVDAAGDPLSFADGLQDETGADHVVFLGETTVPMPSAQHPEGGWIAEGSGGSVNRVYLDSSALGLAFGDYAIITVVKRRLRAEEVHPRLLEWFDPNVGILTLPDEWDAELVDHPGTLPPSFSEPGESCLRVIAADSQTSWAGQYIFHGYDDEEGQWYSQLEPGAPYRAEVWLRQEGLADGHVRFVSGGDYASLSQTTPWTVTDQWQHFSYDFAGPPYPNVLSDPWHQYFGLELTGPGTVWIDNFVVYRNDGAHGFSPFTPHHLSLDEFLAASPTTGRKPAVRFYPVNYPGHSSLDHLLGNYASSVADFIYNVRADAGRVTVPHAMEWCLATGSTPEERAVPFLTLSEEYTEVEWKAVIEYLGVPYDPVHDTQTSKPWAYKRYLQRGHGSPWTDDFREIVLELGNETWHNGAGGYGWHGFGRPGWVHDGGTEYGLFADHYFTQHVAAMPWWGQYDLGSKIHFALGANYSADTWDYGEAAAQGAPTMTAYVGHANYVGPKWETGQTPYQVFDDVGMQETLIGMHTGMKALIEQAAATRDLLAATAGTDYQLIAYEGGPSGYYVPGQGTPSQVAISQLYGKSLGMGVAALDAWLYSSLHGYRHQCFLGFASGDNWSTHTMPRAGGFRRHTGWLALMMRNLHADGDTMLETTFSSVPTFEREGEDVPLASAYAIQGETSTSVFVLSRMLDGEHHGVNFGDGVMPVTVTLPFSACESLTLVKLTAPDGTPADPRVNNIDEENVIISSVALDPALCAGDLVIDEASGGVAGGMPPGTIYLYVFEHADGAVFEDDFESGDVDRWSASVP